jgi:hypothetical protein
MLENVAVLQAMGVQDKTQREKSGNRTSAVG